MLTLQRGKTQILCSRRVWKKCSLFRDDPKLRQSGTYTIKADVSQTAWEMFYSKADNENADVKVTEDNIDELKELCEELGFHGLDAEFRRFGPRPQDAALKRDVCLLRDNMQRHEVAVEGLKHQIRSVCVQLDELRDEVKKSAKNIRDEFMGVFEELRQEVKSLREELGAVRQSSDEQREKAHDDLKELETRLMARVDEQVRGLDASIMSRPQGATAPMPAFQLFPVRVRQDCLIAWLRDQEAALHQKMVVVRQSSNDLYGMLNPNSSDWYGSFEDPGAWIEIELKEAVLVRGVVVKSSSDCAFPKTFEVKLSDGRGCRVKQECSFVNESGLNGKNRSVETTFKPVWARFVRIESCGPNWDRGDHHFHVGGFELLGQHRPYRDGVFRRIFSWGEDDAWRSFDVRARDFDGSEIHIPNPEKNICTFCGDHQWVEVEIVRGSLLVSGYKLRTDSMREWTLRGSNDLSCDLDDWDIIHKTRSQCDDEVQEFQCSWPTPFKYLRLVNEVPDSDGDKRIRLYYFDVCGTFIPD